MSCVTLVKAALARFLFGSHALVTVWRVVSQEGDHYWKIGIGIIVLFCDGLHALCNRKVRTSLSLLFGYIDLRVITYNIIHKSPIL